LERGKQSKCSLSVCWRIKYLTCNFSKRNSYDEFKCLFPLDWSLVWDKEIVYKAKTKHDRTIPISAFIRRMLDDLLAKNGSGYVFSDDCGKTPITNDWLNKGLNRAFKKIRISYEEKLKRNLSFHAWLLNVAIATSTLNTLLLTSNVGLSKVQKVTGHKSLKMTEHYTHFDTKQFTEVVAVQDNLLTFNAPENQIIKAEVIKNR